MKILQIPKADSEYTTLNPIGTLHPGEVLLEYLESSGWTQRDLARRSGVTPKTISEICNRKAPISPRTSLAFEKVFRRPARFWLNLQRQFDETAAREEFRRRSKEWVGWYKKFPVTELKKLGLLHDTGGTSFDPEPLLEFLGVSSPDAWDEVWKASRIAFRQTMKINANIEHIFAWVRATEYFAEQVKVEEFEKSKALNSISQLRECTTMSLEEGIAEAQSICASSGIALVVVPGFKNTGISGCARWLSPGKAMIALTDRYELEDQFWFALFHEIAHILLHGKTLGFVIDNAVNDLFDKAVDPVMQKQEEEANRFAADTMIPPDFLFEFVKNHVFSNDSIKNFSKNIGISPGITVGRLQHDEILKPFQGNNLKLRLNWFPT